MKKLLTLSLAALMVMAIAIPAFADDTTKDADFLKLVDDGFYTLDTDDNVLKAWDGDRVEPGTGLYILIEGNNNGKITSKFANSNRVYTDWSYGKNLIESAKIEQKRLRTDDSMKYVGNSDLATVEALNNWLGENLFSGSMSLSAFETAMSNLPEKVTNEDDSETLIDDVVKGQIRACFTKVNGGNEYVYVVALNVKASYSVKEEDLLGDVSIGKNKTAAKATELRVNTIVAYKVIEADSGEVEKKSVVDFKNADGELTLNFKDVAEFTTTVRDEYTSGSYKKYLGWNQKVNSTVISNNPMANIDFLTFEANPTFNKIGELKIFTDLGRHLYLINADGSLSAVDYRYDSIEECIYLNTRTLGSYAISDVELTVGATTEPTEPTEPSEPSEPSEGGNGGTTTKPVPDTGARA